MTLAQLADHFRAVAAKAAVAPEVAAERTAPVLLAESVGILGTHALRDLLPQTQKERERLGYPPNDPLVREGDYRDTIEGGAVGSLAFAGTASPIGAFLEFGTAKMAPFSNFALAKDAALPLAVAIATEVAREVMEG